MSQALPLSCREMQVVLALRSYPTYRGVAEALALAESTAATYARNARSKLGLKSKSQLAAWGEARRRELEASVKASCN